MNVVIDSVFCIEFYRNNTSIYKIAWYSMRFNTVYPNISSRLLNSMKHSLHLIHIKIVYRQQIDSILERVPMSRELEN